MIFYNWTQLCLIMYFVFLYLIWGQFYRNRAQSSLFKAWSKNSISEFSQHHSLLWQSLTQNQLLENFATPPFFLSISEYIILCTFIVTQDPKRNCSKVHLKAEFCINSFQGKVVGPFKNSCWQVSKLDNVLIIEIDILFKVIHITSSVTTLNIINWQGKVQMKLTIINCPWRQLLRQRYKRFKSQKTKIN